MTLPPHKHPQRLSPAEAWAQRIVIDHVRSMDPIDRIARIDDMY